MKHPSRKIVILTLVVIFSVTTSFVFIERFKTKPPTATAKLSYASNPPSPATPASTTANEEQVKLRVQENFGKMPLYFIENKGQLDNQVSFYVQGSDNTLYSTPQGITYELTETKASKQLPATSKTDSFLHPAAFELEAVSEQPQQRHAVKLDFVRANPNVQPKGEAPTEATFNYFKGKPEQWQTGLKTYAKLIYEALWPGIDLEYSGTANRLKYPFLVKPGAYQTTYSGLTLNESFVTKLNATGNALVYSTYPGSGQGGNDTTRSIAVDSIGNAYVTGLGCAPCPILNSAVNSVSNGPPSNSAAATATSAAAATIPGAPRNLAASGGNGLNGLAWNAPSSNGGATITSYRVFRGTTSSNRQIVTSGGCANLGAVGGCTDTGLTNGQSYNYIVSAVNSVGQGPPSNSVTATPVAPATIPGAPRNLDATADDKKNFLGWNAPSSNGGATITSYRVFRGTTSSNRQIVTSGGCANLGAVLACTDTGLTNGQSYNYIVSAVNSAGQGAPSNSVTATPTGPTLPGAPRNLDAYGDDKKNYLGWNAPSSNGGAAITSYRVFRGTTSTNQQIITSGGCANLGAVLACTDTGLTNGQTYYYIVSAVNSVGQGAPSNQVTATPAPTLSITTTSLDPATATVGVGYGAQQAVMATGGTLPYSWSVSGQPNGMGINSSSGALFGTPTVAGTFNLTVTVRDSSSPQKTASKVLSLTVAATPALSITTTSLPSATVGTGYGEGVTASGGQTPYTWSVSSGLPPGLAINATFGSIFGTPTAAGTFSFTVTVRDSSNPQKTASKGLSITVVGTTTPTLSSITPSSPPESDKRFFAQLNGSNFSPDAVEIVVVGSPGCQNVGTCRIPNSIFKSDGVSNTRINSAPFTLKEGTFDVYVRNGAGGTLSSSVKLTVGQSQPTPAISGISFSTTPIAMQPFTAQIVGSGFNPGTIQAVITGPNCSPCIVENNLLENKSSARVNVPLKLNSVGTFQITLRNGSGGVQSNSKTLNVVPQPPSTFTLSGKIGIVDERWLLDGSGVSLKVELFRNSQKLNLPPAEIRNGQYTFRDLPGGIYDLLVTVAYTEEGNADKPTFKKWAKRMKKGINVSSTPTPDVFFPPVVALVHGILSGYDKWYGKASSTEFNDHEELDREYTDLYWDQYLRFKGESNDLSAPKGFITVTPDYYTNIENDDGWPTAAKVVATQIDTTLRGLSSGYRTYLSPPWYYIGHSQGGLVGRVILNTPGILNTNENSAFVKAVRHMFLVGTPNSGASAVATTLRSTLGNVITIGDPNRLYGYLSKDQIMRRFNPQYPYFSRLGENRVTVYAGEIRFGGGTDGIVPSWSVHKIISKYCGYTGPFWSCIENEISNLREYEQPFDNDHLELGSTETLNSILVEKILPEMKNEFPDYFGGQSFQASTSITSTKGHEGAKSFQLQQNPPTLSNRTQGMRVSHSSRLQLSVGETKSTRITVGSTDLLLVNALIINGAVITRLINPLGQEINFASIPTSLGSNFTDASGEWFALKNPVPGQWEIRTTGSANNANNTIVSLVAQENSIIGLEGYVTENAILQDRQTHLLAKWANGVPEISQPVINARIFDGQGNIIENLPLYDDGAHGDMASGDGIFGADTSAAFVPGSYVVTFVAKGIYQGQLFNREVADHIDVLPISHLFTGQFTDTMLDSNGDGKSDRIQVTAPVNLVLAGKYLVTADLYDSQSYFIDHATAFLETNNPGLASPKLEFDVSQANCDQFSRAFSVRKLTLSDASNFRVWDQWADNVTTQVFDGLSFDCVTVPTGLQITSVQPNAAIKGDSVQVRISGTSFADGATLSLGTGVNVTSITRVSSDLLIAQISVTSDATVGQRDVMVTNPDGRAVIAAGLFSVTSDQAPIISISYPTDGQIINDSFIASASAADDRGIQKVEFYLDGAPINSDSTFPYQSIVNSLLLANGNHLLMAKAYDTSNQVSVAEITFNVDTAGFESDVSPRPNGSRTGSIAIADWVQLGRFAVGIDTPTEGSEFQRADCAPKSTLGDGKITLADWVQAGRYAAGLDPVASAGGFTAPLTSLTENLSMASTAHVSEAESRVVRAADAVFQRGQVNTLSIELTAQGNENALGFSLNFDPKQMSFVDVAISSSANGALLQVNKSQAANGRIGLALALPAGQQFAAGTRTLLTLRFIPNGGDGDVITNISFSDQLLAREIVDAFATPISQVSYTGSTITIRGRAAANVSAASYVGAELAADSIASAFGTKLAMMTIGAVSLPLPDTLGGTTVKVKDAQGGERIAPLFFVSPNQINYQIPAGTAEGIATVTITNGAGEETLGLLNIGKVAPGIFAADASGKGWAAADVVYVASDGSQTLTQAARFDVTQNKFVAVPIDLATNAVVLVLYGTGIRHRADLATVQVKIGGLDAVVDYADKQGQFFGLDQINVRLPKSLQRRGEVPVEVSVEGRTANPVRISIR